MSIKLTCSAAAYVLLTAIAWGADPPRVGSLTTYSNQVVPLVIVGEGWSQQIVVSNVSSRSEAVTGTLKFFTREGKPWEVELRDRAKASTFLINIPTGGIAIYETITRDHEQILGWALLELTSSSGDCLTQSLWRQPAGPT